MQNTLVIPRQHRQRCEQKVNTAPTLALFHCNTVFVCWQLLYTHFRARSMTLAGCQSRSSASSRKISAPSRLTFKFSTLTSVQLSRNNSLSSFSCVTILFPPKHQKHNVTNVENTSCILSFENMLSPLSLSDVMSSFGRETWLLKYRLYCFL